MGSIERLTELVKSLPDAELEQVIRYIEELQAGRIQRIDGADDDWNLFEQYAGSWTGRFHREDCYDRPRLR